MADILKLTHTISLRVARFLEREGIVEADAENNYLTESVLDNKMTDHQGHSILLSNCHRITERKENLYSSNAIPDA